MIHFFPENLKSLQRRHSLRIPLQSALIDDATAPVAARLQRRLDSFWSPRSQHTLPLTQDEEPGDTRYVERIHAAGSPRAPPVRPFVRATATSSPPAVYPSSARIPALLRRESRRIPAPRRAASCQTSRAAPLCVRAAAVASSRALSASPGAAASARATALCVVPGRTTALQRVARSRKRGAPSPSPSAIGPDSHGALRGERSRASRAVRIAPVRVLRRIAPSRVVTRRSPVSFESSSIGGRRVDRDGNGEWNGV
ncbi:hypothetical protein C8R43DRAFT_637659 [Mycena crocata]|nr:hypothetical protein C8R43DRAFT_637659 [Mycena crocata]